MSDTLRIRVILQYTHRFPHKYTQFSTHIPKYIPISFSFYGVISVRKLRCCPAVLGRARRPVPQLPPFAQRAGELAAGRIASASHHEDMSGIWSVKHVVETPHSFGTHEPAATVGFKAGT